MTMTRVRFTRNDKIFGDQEIYVNYRDVLAVLDSVREEAKDSKNLSTRDRLVISETAQALKATLQDVRDRSNI